MIEINAAFQDNCTDLGLLGRADEGRTRSIVFDCKDILGEYPDAKMIAVITQPCTGKKYSASLSERGTDRILVIERSDTAYPGIINIELRAIIDDDGNKRKSAFYKGKIEASMIGEGDAPGAPVRDMLDRAEERLERLSNIRAEAETLKPDEDATASYDNDNAILKLGIPHGKDGGNVDQDPTDEYCGIVNSRNDSVIDQTLTMAGQAADAKACGERFSEKQDVLTDSDRQSIVRIGIVGGAEWTADEQRAARERMGIAGFTEMNHITTIVTEEETDVLIVDLGKQCKICRFYYTFPEVITVGYTYVEVSNTNTRYYNMSGCAINDKKYLDYIRIASALKPISIFAPVLTIANESNAKLEYAMPGNYAMDETNGYRYLKFTTYTMKFPKNTTIEVYAV